MIRQTEITLPPLARGFHLITEYIIKNLNDLPDSGILNIFLKHTSAALTINESYDERVRVDFENLFNHIIPENFPYTHNDEGPDDMPAHIKSSIIGNSVTVPISNGKLNLGTWQGIYLCEFRNRGSARKLVITVYH